MTLTPLDRFEGSLAERTYQSLRQAILDVTYRPGAPLPKREICEALGVSRSPVSEAIARLASDGLVRVVPQAGTFVALFSMAEKALSCARRSSWRRSSTWPPVSARTTSPG